MNGIWRADEFRGRAGPYKKKSVAGIEKTRHSHTAQCLKIKTLTRELEGYAAYAQRVRYRIIPGIY